MALCGHATAIDTRRVEATFRLGRIAGIPIGMIWSELMWRPGGVSKLDPR